MNRRDDLVRAAVIAAFEARGTDGFKAACERVVVIHRLAPMIVAELAIERAETEFERRQNKAAQDIADAIEIIRDSYPTTEMRAAA